jgi:peptide-N4-(N-acetyl-beta-glucosaminyl)asparagine amidase
MRVQFEQLLRTKQLNGDRSRSSSQAPSLQDRAASPHVDTAYRTQSQGLPAQAVNTAAGTPPSYSSLRRLPQLPSPPRDAQSQKFRSLLLTLSAVPINYENPGLLDEALLALPLDRIYGEAQEESDMFEATAQSMGDGRKPEWGYQDCVIRALLRYVTCSITIQFLTY